MLLLCWWWICCKFTSSDAKDLAGATGLTKQQALIYYMVIALSSDFINLRPGCPELRRFFIFIETANMMMIVIIYHRSFYFKITANCSYWYFFRFWPSCGRERLSGNLFTHNLFILSLLSFVCSWDMSNRLPWICRFDSLDSTAGPLYCDSNLFWNNY